MTDYLQSSEYNKNYFNPEKPISGHPAGYSNYQKWYRTDLSFSGITGSFGELYADLTQRFVSYNSLNQNHLLVELGCAKGFIVEELRNRYNYDAWGMDVSSYAISGADPSISGYVFQSDARTGLANWNNNQIDFLYSYRFLECIPLTDMPQLVSDMNKYSKNQLHIITENPNTGYYTAQPISWWATGFSWEKGTRLIGAKSLEMISV